MNGFYKTCGDWRTLRFGVRTPVSRDNLGEKSGNQGENGRIAEPCDDRRWHPYAQADFAFRLTRSVTPALF
jgi:hypothetical protein